MGQLAIRGHETRGKEVIEILEMLGGKTSVKLTGHATLCGYYINQEGCILYKRYDDFDDNYIPYTLEEFLEKYPYKVGDKVSSKFLKNFKIEKMEWTDISNRVIYKLQGVGWYSADELQPYKETMEDEEENFAECIENTVQECLFGKEKTMEEKGDKAKAPNLIGEDYSGKRFGYKIPKGYEFDCIKNNEIILKPKQPEYPKNYKECCDVLGINTMDNDAQGYKGGLIICFQELIIARDAYWKIAGEKMGLGKPWEPDFDNENEDKYGIFRSRNIIYKDTTCINPAPTWLIFPTEEMRDAFYENFKSLIEECKELL